MVTVEKSTVIVNLFPLSLYFSNCERTSAF